MERRCLAVAALCVVSQNWRRCCSAVHGHDSRLMLGIASICRLGIFTFRFMNQNTPICFAAVTPVSKIYMELLVPTICLLWVSTHPSCAA